MFCFVHIASYVCCLWFTVMLYVFKKFMFVHVVLCQFSLSCCMFMFMLYVHICDTVHISNYLFPCCICCIFLYMLYLVLLVVLVISYQNSYMHGTLTNWLCHVWLLLCRTLMSLVLYVCQIRWNLCNKFIAVPVVNYNMIYKPKCSFFLSDKEV